MSWQDTDTGGRKQVLFHSSVYDVIRAKRVSFSIDEASITLSMMDTVTPRSSLLFHLAHSPTYPETVLAVSLRRNHVSQLCLRQPNMICRGRCEMHLVLEWRQHKSRMESLELNTGKRIDISATGISNGSLRSTSYLQPRIRWSQKIASEGCGNSSHDQIYPPSLIHCSSPDIGNVEEFTKLDSISSDDDGPHSVPSSSGTSLSAITVESEQRHR